MKMGTWKSLKQLKELDRDDLLDAIGLETKRHATDYIVPALAVFGLGVLVGAGVGLLLAPKPGAELRGDLRARLGRNGQAAGAVSPEAGASARAT